MRYKLKIMESQRDYMSRRAREEQGAAERAASEKVRELHMELAARYREAADADPELRVADVKVRAGLPSDFRILE
jgi:hypothetical protein